MPNCNNSRFRRRGILHQPSGIDPRKIRNRNCLIFSACTSCTGTLLLHLLLKAFAIQGDSILVENLFGKLTREAVGIIEFEPDFAVENGFIGRFQACNLIIQKLDSLCQRGRKAIFFHTNHTLDIVLFCQEITEIFRIAENFNDGIHRIIKERLCDPEHTSMSNCTAECAAQNVSAPLIRWQNAIHNHDSNRTRMVCNDLE